MALRDGDVLAAQPVNEELRGSRGRVEVRIRGADGDRPDMYGWRSHEQGDCDKVVYAAVLIDDHVGNGRGYRCHGNHDCKYRE
jgi:hypothetical protein